MAKENFVLLVGELIEVPKVNREQTIGKFKLKTLRRNDKYDTPVVRVSTESTIKKLPTFSVGDFIMVKGIVSTRDIIKRAECPKCKEINKVRGTTTEVLAIDIVDIGPNFKLEDLKEFSNIVRMLGTLCREPSLTTTSSQSTVSLCKYQIAANRKLNVASEPDTYTDYPWVNSFGRQAEQDALHIETGSQIYIDGGLQTRVLRRECHCENCGCDYKTEGDIIIEIVPHSVEYLNNCKFD